MMQKTKLSLALLAALTMTGCLSSSDDKKDNGNNGGGNGGGDTTSQVVTLDASSVAAHLDLATGETVTSDDNWHIAYQRNVGFKVNGGASGSGDVKACIAHQYADLFDADGKPIKAEFEKLTAANTLTSFEAVDVNDPDICTPIADSVSPLLPSSGWWTYNPDPAAAGVVTIHTDDSNGWIVKSADGTAYGRIRFTHFATRQYTMRLEVENWNGTAFETADESPDLAFGTDAVYWDLETNSIVTEADDWELKFSAVDRNIQIQVNGGASGSGLAGIVGADKDGNPKGVGALQSDSVWAVTNPTLTTQVFRYFADSAKGAFSGPAYMGALEYGMNFVDLPAGSMNHDMWPTFATYLIEDNGIYYKMQVISNKGEDGTASSGTLRVRYSDFSK